MIGRNQWISGAETPCQCRVDIGQFTGHAFAMETPMNTFSASPPDDAATPFRRSADFIRQVLPSAGGVASNPSSRADRSPACEYVDIGRGNGFLMDAAGERPAMSVIGEIG